MFDTNYMDRFFSFETREQKIRAVIFGVIVVVLIGVGIYVTTPKSQSPQQSSQPGPAAATQTGTGATQQGSGFGSLPGNGGNPQVTMRIYQTSTYKILYPPTWTTQNGVVQGGGELVIMQPPGAQGGYPSLKIQVMPAAVAPIANTESVFTAFGFPKTTVKFAGADADKFSGTLPLQPPLQETAYVFPYLGKSYLIKYDYLSKTVDKGQEDQFQQVLSTFSFGQ